MRGAAGGNRLYVLDGLRGIAALLVVVFHYTTMFPVFYPDALMPAFTFPIGQFGVHLFFMISGFVILMTLEKRGASAGFVKARFFRLYPIFWVCILITATIMVVAPPPGHHQTLQQILVNFTMVEEYVKIKPVDGVYWSLTYELGFYFFMFWVFRLKLEKWLDWITGFWILGTVFFALLEPYIPHPLHYLLVFNNYGSLFAAGLLLYRIYSKVASPARTGLLVAAILAQFMPTWGEAIQESLMQLISVAALAGIFSLALFTKALNYLGGSLFVFLGRISYPLYLIHQMVGYALINAMQQSGIGWWASVSLAFVVAIGIASALTLMIDEPVRRRISKA